MALPPGPTAHPLIQTLAFLLSPQGSLERASARYGDLFTVRSLVFGPQVLTTDPEIIKQVFTGDPEVYHAGEANSAAKFLSGERSIMVLDGADHLRMRRLMMPPFHGERIHAYADLMREITEEVIAGWKAEAPFSLLPAFQRITLDIIVTAVFGLKTGPRRDLLREKLLTLVERVASPVGFMMLIPAFQRDLGPLWPWRAFKALMDAVNSLIYEEIAARRAVLAEPAADRPNDVLSLLLGARDEAGVGMEDAEIRDQLITLLSAGYETTATSLAWAFERILGHPEVHARLMEEISAAVAAGKTSPEDLTKLPYLDATIKEVLRQRSPLPTIGRRVKRPVMVRDYELPIGTMISPLIHLTHRRPDLYPEPEAFRPERFLDKKADPYGYLPFGGGIRRCIGMPFALYEMKIVVGTVLQRASLRLVRRAPLKVVSRSLFFGPEGGTEVVLSHKH